MFFTSLVWRINAEDCSWFFTHPIWIEMKLFACLRTVIIGVLLLLSYACHHQFTTGTSHSLSFGLWCQMLLWMNKNPLGMWNNKEIQCVLIFVLCILLTNTIMLGNRKETWRGPFLQNKYRVLQLNWYHLGYLYSKSKASSLRYLSFVVVDKTDKLQFDDVSSLSFQVLLSNVDR